MRQAGVFMAALLLTVPVRASVPGPALLSQYVRTTWGIADGLPSASCGAMAQTPDGFLWIATMEGLVRFDGLKVEVFDTARVPELKGNEIRELLVDDRGTLWIGTARSGLLEYREGRFRRIAAYDGPVADLAEGVDGVLLVCATEGVYRLAGERLERLDLGLRWKRFRGFGGGSERGAGLWIQGDGGVLAWLEAGRESAKVRAVEWPTARARGKKAERRAPSTIETFEEDGDGAWLVGTDLGFFRVRRGGTAEAAEAPRTPSRRIPSVRGSPDSQGGRWFFRAGHGICRQAGGAESCVGPSEGFSGEAVTRVFEDREGSVFVSSWDAGLTRFAPAPFRSFGPAEGLGSHANAVLEDSSGTVWAGTKDGLYRFRDGTPERVALPADESRVLALSEGADGNVSVGTWNSLHEVPQRGPPRRVPGEWKGAFALLHDSRGRLFVGGPSVQLIDKGRTTEVPLDISLAYLLTEDSKGRIWAGGVNGLFQIEPGPVRRVRTASDIARDLPFTAHESSRGLFFGMLEGGLNVLRGETFTKLGAADGLPSDSILGIVEDDESLWLATGRGICRVSHRDLDARLSDPRDRLTPRLFDIHDGVGSLELSGTGQPTAIRARDGRLYFCTTTGLTTVHPRDLGPSTWVPPVHVARVLVDDRPVPLASLASLPAGRRRIVVDYTGISLRSPTRVRFRHRLRGFGEGWIETARRTVEYPGLGHGSYVLEIAARLEGGAWGTARQVPISIAPLLWERTSIRAFAGVLVLGFALALHRRRLSRLRRERADLEELVRFGRTLAGILDPLAIAKLFARELRERLGARWVLVELRREGREPLTYVEGDALTPLEREVLAAIATSSLGETPRQPWLPVRPEGLEGVLLPMLVGGTSIGYAALAKRGGPIDDVKLAHAASMAGSAALAIEGAFQAQDAVRWRRVSDARSDWLRLDLPRRLAFGAVARLGAANSERVVATIREALSEQGLASLPALEGALERLCDEELLSRSGDGTLEVKRSDLLLLPELGLPLAEIARQSVARVGAFRLEERIGAGGMGEVFRARNVHDGSEAAVKLLYPHLAVDAAARQRLKREGDLVTSVKHPNVVRLLERGEQDGRLYIAMELVRGEPVARLLASGRRFTESEVWLAAGQMGRALQTLHAHGVAHRDLNANNVMYDEAGARFVILDFGLAKGLGQATLTREHTVLGTLPYMSPEQLRGEGAGPESDIWALGVVLHEMLTGALPWAGATSVEIALEILRRENVPGSRGPDAAEPTSALQQAIAACLLSDPVARRAGLERLLALPLS